MISDLVPARCLGHDGQCIVGRAFATEVDRGQAQLTGERLGEHTRLVEQALLDQDRAQLAAHSCRRLRR